MNKIKQLIEEIISEEIKNLEESKKRLDLKAFYELSNADPQEKYLWLMKNGTLLGQGSSRAVFLIDSSKVLKLAYVGVGYRHYVDSEAGIEQNKAEVQAYTNPKVKPIVAKIFDFADDYSWIISELVKPLEGNPDEWEKLTGLKWIEFVRYIRPSKRKNLPEEMIEKIEKLPFIKKVQNLIAQEETQEGDMVDLDHWGKTADNKIVLLDYGYNADVAPLYW